MADSDLKSLVQQRDEVNNELTIKRLQLSTINQKVKEQTETSNQLDIEIAIKRALLDELEVNTLGRVKRIYKGILGVPAEVEGEDKPKK